MRKQITYTVPVEDANRDSGKRFRITEMPSSQGEAWAMRVLMAMRLADVQLPPELEQRGLMGLAEYALKAFTTIQWEDAQPLLAELMTCVQFLPKQGDDSVVRNLVEDDIEEVKTRFKIRKEVISLHVDFSGAAERLTSLLAASQNSSTPST